MLSNEVLTASHKFVGNLAALANSGTAEIVDISGKQRMLSQRIAKNFLAHYWGVIAKEDENQFWEDLAEYENTLGYLQANNINTIEIERKLAKTAGYFAYASRGFEGAMKLSGPRLIHVITGTTDSMLKSMNDVTGMYANLLNDSSSAVANK